MPKRGGMLAKIRPRRPTITIDLGPEHLGRLEECIDHFRTEVADEERRRIFGYRTITRSAMIRMAIDALHTALLRGDRPVKQSGKGR